MSLYYHFDIKLLKKEGEKKTQVFSLHINPEDSDDVWMVVSTGNKELIKPVYLKDKNDPETVKEIEAITDMVYDAEKKNIKSYVVYYYLN